MDGIININKPKGLTSQQVVTRVKRILGVKKAGHTGTLDPNATGVLPICLGKATRLASIITGGEKAYKAQLILGKTTDTQDITGTVLEEKEVNATEEQISDAIFSFKGEIEQVPPMYSAIKVNGVRLHQLARQNIEVERKARKVHIYNIDVHGELTKKGATIEVRCSAGTYIRTLCSDIGDKLDCGATMGELQRTYAAGFFIHDALTLEDLENFCQTKLIPMDKILGDYIDLRAKMSATKFLVNGNKIELFEIIDMPQLKENDCARLYDEKGNFFGLYKLKDNMLVPEIYLG